jgi:hypothetical protein
MTSGGKRNSNNERRRRKGVGIATGYGLDDRVSTPGIGKRFFSSPQRPGRLWGPPSILFNGNRWSLSSRGKADRA